MDESLPLLNTFEVDTEDGVRCLVGFMDAVLAGARGIDSRAMIGEFTPGPDGEFDLNTFEPNPEFIEVFEEYMNDEPSQSAEVVTGALNARGEPLFLVDPRCEIADGEEPPLEDVLGCYEVDDAGNVVEGSFAYNPKHLWFNPESGISGMLADRRFYDWLHTS